MGRIEGRMPNLIPQSVLGRWWLGWAHPAGRLIFATVAIVVALAFVAAAIRPPMFRHLITPRQGVPLALALVIGCYVIAVLVNSLQIFMVWVAFVGVVAIALACILSRPPRSQERKATWSEAMGGAVGVFFVMVLGYAVIPSEWITFSDKYLQWTPDKVFVDTYPVKVSYQAIRDIVVVVIYGAFFGLNLLLWKLWQQRLTVKPAAVPEGEGEAKVVRTSRFGRPVKAKV